MEKLINEFSSGLFFWQLILFVTLIFLLRKFAWKPILDAVNEREKTIIDSLNSAKEAQKEMENLQTANKKILQEARAESDAMLNQSKKSGKEIIEKANSGLVHEEKNKDDFSSKVLELYLNKEKAEELGKRGKQFIENEFSWEITSKALVKLYDEL